MSILDTKAIDKPLNFQPALERSTQNYSSPAVRIVRTFHALEGLRNVWDSWCNDPNSDFEYYLASAHCRPDIVLSHVMVVYRDGQPDCILVGRVECRRLKLKVGYSTLFESKANVLFLPQGSLFGNCSEENCQLLAHELKLCLNGRDGDSAEFLRLTPDSQFSRALQKELGFFQRGHFTSVHEHRWLELPASYKEFVQHFSRKDRHEYRRHEKKLATEFCGRTHIHYYRQEDAVKELARDVEKISSKAYQRALGVGFRPHDEASESLQIAARSGGLRGCVLYLDESPSAFSWAGNTKILSTALSWDSIRNLQNILPDHWC